MSYYWFTENKSRFHARLALFTFLFAFVVILLGAYTRLTDAGLSCPDWPHCYGFITAPHTNAQLQDAMQKYPAAPVNIKKAWTEMVHRYFAGTEGILILFLAGAILFGRNIKNTKSTFIALSLIVLLGVQVLLGMLTVTEKLKPVIVLSHLVTGLSILAMLWWAYLEFSRRNAYTKTKAFNLRRRIWLGFLIVIAQISLGGWVSTHYAGLACIDFPYCNGKLLPAMQWTQLNTDLITIHMLHRIGAFITASYLIFLTLNLLKHSAFRAFGILILMLVCLQLMLGVFNIIWLRPVWIALFHHATAILILLTMIALLVKSYFTSQEMRYVS